jgi:hypothetical protein
MALCRYLTTNFDDEIVQRLSALGQYFTTLRNRLEDFYPIRDGASFFVQKLHSDLNHPEEAVLTSADYRRLYVGISGQYFRDRLKAIFQMLMFLLLAIAWQIRISTTYCRPRRRQPLPDIQSI